MLYDRTLSMCTAESCCTLLLLLLLVLLEIEDHRTAVDKPGQNPHSMKNDIVLNTYSQPPLCACRPNGFSEKGRPFLCVCF